MTDRWFVRALVGPLVAIAVTIYAGCGAPSPTPSPSPTAEGASLRERAEAEARAIVESAEATAVVLRARETAQALIQGPSAALKTTPASEASAPLPAPTPTSAAGATTPAPGAATATPNRLPTGSATKAASTGVTVEKVTFVADGGLVMASYRAPEAAAQRYWQGSVYMVDEATGAKFDNVATMPVIGPLIQRPKKDGQSGYVIFYNRSVEGTALRAGDVVTVVLNNLKQEHVFVTEN